MSKLVTVELFHLDRSSEYQMAIKQTGVSSYHAYIFCSYMGVSLGIQWSCAIDSSCEYQRL